MASLVYFGGTIFMIATFIDTIIIMSLLGTAAAGIFALGSVSGRLGAGSAKRRHCCIHTGFVKSMEG